MIDYEKATELVALLARDARAATQRELAIARRRDEVRIFIERAVQVAVAEHRATNRILIPEASKLLESVVQPWWRVVVSTGLFEQILDWTKRSGREYVRVSVPVEFPAPYRGLTELNCAHREGRKPFEHVAKELVNDPDFVLSSADIQRLSTQEERWRLCFGVGKRITRDRRVIDTGLYAVYARPGDSLGSGGIVPLSLPNPVELLEREVNAKPIIDFAREITSGVVWTHLRESLWLGVV